MAVELPPRAEAGPDLKKDDPHRYTLRLDAERQGMLTELWRAYSLATDRPWTLSEVLVRCLTDAYASLLRQTKAAREAEDAAFAAGDDSAPAQVVTQSAPPLHEGTAASGAYFPPRKPRKGGGTVIDWAAVRRQADAGNPFALGMIGGKAASKKETMRDNVARNSEGK